MKPSITRRRLIAGTGTAALASAGAVALPTRYYPAPVLDWLVGQRSKPTLDWRPPISQSLYTESHERLRERADRAATLWSRIEDDETDDSTAVRMAESAFRRLESRVDSLADATPSRNQWFDLVKAHAAAGRAIGGALVALEEVDPQAIVDRGEQLRSQLLSTSEQIDYRIEDPGVDLGWLYQIERSLELARLNTHRNGTYTGGTVPATEYDAFSLVRTMAAHAEAREGIRLASHWYEAYTDRLDDPRDVTGELETLQSAYADEVSQRRVSHTDVQQSLEDFETGPYRHARQRLVMLTARDLQHTTGDLDTGFLALQTVQSAKNVLKLRGYESALEAFSPSPGESVAPIQVYRAERRATNQLRAATDLLAAPLGTGLLRDAEGRVRSGHLGLDDDRRPRLSRAAAYAAYLAGEHQLRHAADVLAPFRGDGLTPSTLE